MILLEVIWWLLFFFFFTFQHGASFVFTFPGTLYMLAKLTHTDHRRSKCCSKKRWWRKSEGGYIDEARGLLFSLLISLNLLIPILKPATLQRWHLLCVAPSQIKQSFITLPFKRHGIQRSSISFAFALCVSFVLIYSHTFCVNSVTSNTTVTYCYTHTRYNKAFSSHCVRAIRSWQEVSAAMFRFKTYLTWAKDNEWRATPVHSALLIKLSLL